jgi:hypothetical protein
MSVAIIPLSKGPAKRFGISRPSAGTSFSGAGMDLLNNTVGAVIAK